VNRAIAALPVGQVLKRGGAVRTGASPTYSMLIMMF
jgi:hypothetical protein